MAEDGWKVFSTHLVADGTQMVVVYERKYRV